MFVKKIVNNGMKLKCFVKTFDCHAVVSIDEVEQ